MTQEELSNFEIELIEKLRAEGVVKMSYPGSITIHYDNDINPNKVEIREIRKSLDTTYKGIVQ